jgi:hypothetical protein
MSSVTVYLPMGAHGSSSISDKVRSRGSNGTVEADAAGTDEEDAVGTVDDDGAEGFRAVDEDVAGDFRRVDDDWTEGSLFLFDEPGGPPPGSLFLFDEPGVRAGGRTEGRLIRRL